MIEKISSHFINSYAVFAVRIFLAQDSVVPSFCLADIGAGAFLLPFYLSMKSETCINKEVGRQDSRIEKKKFSSISVRKKKGLKNEAYPFRIQVCLPCVDKKKFVAA